MAYRNRFRFRFDSVHGMEYNIYILKDGYTGGCDRRPLGRAPVLKKKKNGPIHGTSLELYAQCDVDGEFAELYTSDPKTFKVEVYRKSGGNDVLIWQGFVSTELYSEPSIAPPYDVKIVATDGLGELKLNNFEEQGEVSLISHFVHLLSFTGSDLAFYFATNLRHTGSTKAQMLNWTVNIDFLAGKTCYDVLTRLLDSLHATITERNGRWIIARETDIEALITNQGSLAVISYNNGTISTTNITGVRYSVGQMGVAAMHPWGYLSMAVEPARKSVVVKAPWHMVGGLEDSEMTDDTSANWSVGAYSQFNSVLGKGYYIGDGRSSYDAIYQEIPMEYMKCGFSFIVKAMASNTGGSPNTGSMRLYAEWRVGSANPVVGTSRGWDSNDWSNISVIDLGKVAIAPLSLQEYRIDLPALDDSSPGTLRIIIEGKNVYVSSANLELLRESGFQDTVNIDNGARGDGEDVEIIGSRVLSEGLQNKNFYQGFWKYSGDELYSFADSNHSNADFLSIQALDRAVSVALARKRVEGTLDVPLGLASSLPLILQQGQQNLWLETFEWDLWNDEVKISALSTPNANITVESESVVPMTGGSGGSSSGGGSGSGGSGGGSGSGVSMADVESWVNAQGFLTEVTQAEILAALGYVPAKLTDAQLMALQAPPTLVRRKGWDDDGTNYPVPASGMTDTIEVTHPLLGVTGFEAVLMVYRKRNSRSRPRGGHKAWVNKKGWCQATGDYQRCGYVPFTSASGSVSVQSLRTYIVKRHIVIFGLTPQQVFDNVTATDICGQYKANQKHFSAGSCEMRFGFAVRCLNPAFVEATAGQTTPYKDTFQAVYSDDTGKMEPRYLYSAVAPITAFLRTSAPSGVKQDRLDFGLIPKG